MLIRVNLEIDEDEEWTAHCPDLPGCTWWAGSKQAAMAMTPEAVSRFCSWLQVHGEINELQTSPYELACVEECAGKWTDKTYFADACFTTDMCAATRQEIDRVVRWLGYSRADLLCLVRRLDQRSLSIDTAPPGRICSIASMLDHLAGVEWWYLANLGLLEGGRPPEPMKVGGPLDYLDTVRQQVLHAIANVPQAALGMVRTPSTGESWTVRKVLRRLVWHELYHIEGIRNGLSKAGI